MAKEVKKLAWQDIDVATVKGKAGKALEELTASQDATAKKLDAFKAAFLEDARKSGKVPAGKTLRFSDRWGKIAVAIVDESDERPGKFSL